MKVDYNCVKWTAISESEEKIDDFELNTNTSQRLSLYYKKFTKSFGLRDSENWKKK